MRKPESTVTLYGVTGRGANKKTADADAKTNLALAVKRLHHGPVTARVVGARGDVVTMAIPDDTGWRYLTLVQPGRVMPSGDLSLKCFSFGPDEDPGSIRASLTRHAGQIAWSPEQADDKTWCQDAALQCGTLGATVAQDLHLWCMFQRAYAKAVSEGKTQEEAHAFASRESTYEKLESV